MRVLTAAALLLLSTGTVAASAQTTQAPTKAAPAAPSAPAPTATGYSVEDTEIGTLLDDPAAKAAVDKHLPGFSANEQIDMARGMTLKTVQQYAPDKVTDKQLADLQVDLSKLPVKK